MRSDDNRGCRLGDNVLRVAHNNKKELTCANMPALQVV